jgi:hypothetical protein
MAGAQQPFPVPTRCPRASFVLPLRRCPFCFSCPNFFLCDASCLSVLPPRIYSESAARMRAVWRCAEQERVRQSKVWDNTSAPWSETSAKNPSKTKSRVSILPFFLGARALFSLLFFSQPLLGTLAPHPISHISFSVVLNEQRNPAAAGGAASRPPRTRHHGGGRCEHGGQGGLLRVPARHRARASGCRPAQRRVPAGTDGAAVHRARRRTLAGTIPGARARALHNPILDVDSQKKRSAPPFVVVVVFFCSKMLKSFDPNAVRVYRLWRSGMR